MNSMSTPDGWDGDNGRGVIAAHGTTKARIERAALALFSERGVDGVSVKQIAARAGISDGGLYRYYKSKHELASTLMFAIHKQITNMVRAIEKEDLSFDAKISALVARYCALADEDWQLFSYHILHLHHFPDLFTPSNRKPVDTPARACADMLETGMEAGDIPAGNTELLAGMALGIIVQAAASKTYGHLGGSLSTYAPQFERAVLAIVYQK